MKLLRNNLKTFVTIAAFSLIPTLLVWLPFFLRLDSVWGIPLPKEGMATVVANYDGPLYIVVSKSLYATEIINNFSFSLPAIYYAAHFPMFPLLIKPLAFLFGSPYSMLIVTTASSILALFFFYKLALLYLKKNDALWLTFVFSIFPARWLVVRSVGSPEPLFLAAIIASIYFFKKQKYLFSGIWGAVAVLTKSPGMLLFAAYFAIIIHTLLNKLTLNKIETLLKPKRFFKFTPLLLIPFGLFLLFCFYQRQYNDFFAYFHSGDNIHLFFPPFQIFNYSQPWVGTFWLEEIIFIYVLSVAGLLQLIKRKETVLAWFTGIFLFTIFFVSHRDIVRYALPTIPFLLISYSPYLIKKEFKYIILIILVPIYLFSIAYISQNVTPVSNWAPFL